MIRFFLLTTYSLLLTPLWGQFELQVGSQPGGHMGIEESTAPTRPSIDPFADQLAQEFLQTHATGYWQTIEVSTANAAREFTSYIRRGFGRLEFITLLLMAQEAQKKLSELVNKRIKGAKLKEMAEELKLSYASIRSQAYALKNKLLDLMRRKLENSKDGTGTATSSTTTKTTP